MQRISLSSALLAGAFILAASSPFAAADEVIRIGQTELGQPVTLTGAKQLVTRWLDEKGERQLRVGRAEFDRDGNVAIEVVSPQGIAVRHMLVDAKSGQVAVAQTRKRG